jgi:endogenous inhibitor of DNA gyrase (YacG/DUF329 family)
MPKMKCPICNRPADPEHKPFCSKRCAEVDLGRWLTDDYRIPQAELPEDDQED